jgi:L-asparaginase
VVLASRCAGGPVLEESYAGVGSETHLRSVGLLPAGDLAPLKARLRLMAAVAMGVSPADVFSG